MSGPLPGRYRIQSILGPFVGANFGGTGNVVADGSEGVFIVAKSENGNYTLSLPQGFTREDHGNVVASPIKLPPGIWSIRELRDGINTIEVPNVTPPTGWNLYDTNPNAYVAVGNISDSPQPGQLWRFIAL
ncbi:hypothetical protein OG21DRAFT_1511878 [Imleria badia]|nr:hypothetical protein OG21DRAFT_1511878 [Imleria badia]